LGFAIFVLNDINNDYLPISSSIVEQLPVKKKKPLAGIIVDHYGLGH